MNHLITKIAKLGAITVFAISVAACAGKQFSAEVANPQVVATPAPDKSLLIIMRPSVLGGAISSPVFDVTGGEPKLIGMPTAKSKFAYQVEPGKKRLMVVGESADFLEADVEAGKTYYAVVTPRVGVWKARFSLRPIKQTNCPKAAEFQFDSKDFAEWDSSSKFIELIPAADGWMQDNLSDVKQKQAEYSPKWDAKPAEEKICYSIAKEDAKP
jgi:hypothetical protein